MDSSFIVLVPFFSIRPLTREEKKQNERKYARFQGHFRCKKDLISSFDETRSFQFLLFKISHIEDKDFYLGRDKSNLREQKMCQCELSEPASEQTHIFSQLQSGVLVKCLPLRTIL